MTKEDIISTIEKMTVLELNELVKELEEKFDVKAAMPMAFAGPMPGATAAAAEEEKTDFDVVLKGYDAKSKIKVIKVIREITGLGLKEAKAVVDGVPTNIKEEVSKDDAEKVKAQIEEVGGEVEIK